MRRLQPAELFQFVAAIGTAAAAIRAPGRPAAGPAFGNRCPRAGTAVRRLSPRPVRREPDRQAERVAVAVGGADEARMARIGLNLAPQPGDGVVHRPARRRHVEIAPDLAQQLVAVDDSARCARPGSAAPRTRGGSGELRRGRTSPAGMRRSMSHTAQRQAFRRSAGSAAAPRGSAPAAPRGRTAWSRSRRRPVRARPACRPSGRARRQMMIGTRPPSRSTPHRSKPSRSGQHQIEQDQVGRDVARARSAPAPVAHPVDLELLEGQVVDHAPGPAPGRPRRSGCVSGIMTSQRLQAERTPWSRRRARSRDGKVPPWSVTIRQDDRQAEAAAARLGAAAADELAL